MLPAQYTLLLIQDKEDEQVDLSWSSADIKVRDFVEAHNVLRELADEMIERDHLEFSVDSLARIDSLRLINAYIHIGPAYSFTDIRPDSAAHALLAKLHLSLPTDASGYLELRQRLADYYGENGYPFAQVKLSDFIIEEGRLNARLTVDKGARVRIDTVLIKGYPDIRPSFWTDYLDISSRDIYNHKKVTSIGNRINQLAFAEMAGPVEMSLFADHLNLTVPVRPRNASRFDLILGLIPTNAIEDRSLFFSVDLTAEMHNKLGYGEYLYVDFERLRPEQQRFQLSFNYPYILETDFGVDMDFRIQRNSLDFQTLSSDLGIRYQLAGIDYLKLGWHFESSRLIDVDTSALLTTGHLPEELDYNLTGLVLESRISALDYRFNPRKGYSIFLRGSGGSKSVRKNPDIFTLKNEVVDFSSSYDSLDLAVPRYELVADLVNYIPLGPGSTLMTRLRAGWRYAENGLLRNEKFQIGGHQLMRGFDEASVFTSHYIVSTITYRLLLSDNSYISLPFMDVGLVEEFPGNTIWLVGIGGGLGVETTAGLFSFSVAVGKRGGDAFDLGRPKAHIGYVSLF